jgi:hypothetical protein
MIDDETLAQLNRDKRREKLAQKKVKRLALALVKASAPIWHWGDGCGGGVIDIILREAESLGYEVEKHYSYNPRL